MTKWEKIGEPKPTFKEKYIEQLQDKRWKDLRDKVIESSNYQCISCKCVDKPLHVHHKKYVSGRKAWEYHISLLECLCKDCHQFIHKKYDEKTECYICGKFVYKEEQKIWNEDEGISDITVHKKCQDEDDISVKKYLEKCIFYKDD